MENIHSLAKKSNQDLRCMIVELHQHQERLKQKYHDEKEALITIQKKWIAKHEKLEKLYNKLLEQLKLSRLKRFGQSTETSEQLKLFDESDQKLPLETQETVSTTDQKKSSWSKGKPRKRRALPHNLPVEEKVYDISESDKTCACGKVRHRIGEEVSEQLKFIPAKLVIIRHIRPKYGCRGCEEGIKIAPMPVLLLPKSMATPELVAQTILSKYEDQIPLYRQQKQWERLGIDLPRHSCCAWVMKTADLSEPLWKLLKKDVLKSSYVQADETPVLVLKTGDSNKRKKGYMWVYRSHPPNGPSSVYFEYQPGRSGQYAAEFLKDFKGYLQSDMYKGYDFIKKKEGVTHVGCMAHARRYFADIVKANVHKKPGLAHQAMKFFKALYKVERRIKHESIEKRYAVRQEKSVHILTQFKKWLGKAIHLVPDGFAIGKAIHYCLAHWTQLSNYTKHGLLHIDNNLVENNIRPFALGRKNWMFKGSPRGAKAGAIFYSLLATCKAHQINPEQYLVKMLSHIRHCKTTDDFRKLLPYHIQL